MEQFRGHRAALRAAACGLVAVAILSSCDAPSTRTLQAEVTASWSSVALPHVVSNVVGEHATTNDGRPTYAVEYGRASLNLLGSNARDRYGKQVLSLAATRSAALVLVQDGSKPPALLRLGADGKQTRVGSNLVGIPLADTFGDLAVWAERPAGQTDLTIRAYDLRRSAELARITTPLNALVTAVDSTAAYFVARGRPWRWELSSQSVLEPVAGPKSTQPAGDIVSASHASGMKVWSMADRRTLLERPDGGFEAMAPDSTFGLFDRTASHLALAGAGGYQVRDLETGHEVDLRLPANASIVSFAWGLDDSLVVMTQLHDEPGRVVPFGCTFPRGTCTRLGAGASAELSPAYVESSARGQLQAENPDWE